MPVSEAQKRATAKFEKERYDKVLVRFPKGTKEKILNSGAESVNSFIIKCVLNALESSQNTHKSEEKVKDDKNINDLSNVESLAELQALIDEKRAKQPNEEERERIIERMLMEPERLY